MDLNTCTCSHIRDCREQLAEALPARTRTYATVLTLLHGPERALDSMPAPRIFRRARDWLGPGTSCALPEEENAHTTDWSLTRVILLPVKQ